MIFNTHYPYVGGSGGVPQFTYTGTYEYIDDGGGNWRIKFMTSGIFTPLKAMTIDTFLVGGGGGGMSGEKNPTDSNKLAGSGGGGGKTVTVKSVTLTANTGYSIAVGAGGNVGTDGSTTTAFGNSADGGKKGYKSGNIYYGGAGGSGGGCQLGNGGSNGSAGASNGSFGIGGAGQGTTTREFGESTGELYAGGGGGSYNKTAPYSGGAGGGGNGYAAGADNYGGGGGCNAKGGSGIVIIRKAK